jgi:hypothetical protein
LRAMRQVLKFVVLQEMGAGAFDRYLLSYGMLSPRLRGVLWTHVAGGGAKSALSFSQFVELHTFLQQGLWNKSPRHSVPSPVLYR